MSVTVPLALMLADAAAVALPEAPAGPWNANTTMAKLTERALLYVYVLAATAVADSAAMPTPMLEAAPCPAVFVPVGASAADQVPGVMLVSALKPFDSMPVASNASMSGVPAPIVKVGFPEMDAVEVRTGVVPSAPETTAITPARAVTVGCVNWTLVTVPAPVTFAYLTEVRTPEVPDPLTASPLLGLIQAPSVAVPNAETETVPDAGSSEIEATT